jgi:N-methylhydantoinase A/oxoprolinase/acetone carboxylase beta subunit
MTRGGFLSLVSIWCVSYLRLDQANGEQGGTSTDVSRYDGSYETVFETTTAGITIQSPQLDINTCVAFAAIAHS